MRRRGPRPLPLLLTHAMLKSLPCATDWPSWSAGSIASLATLASEAAAADPALIAGIAAYRRHTWQRQMPEPPVLWQEGGSRLLDYAEAGAAGLPVLFVPSLVNRAYILDLAPGRSMLRWLAAQGLRPLLLDWGFPDEAARGFTLTDYVAGRLHRAVLAAGTGPVLLAGYCMGGLLALAAAQLEPERVAGLALLATPWDFHAEAAETARALASMLPVLEPAMAAMGALPTDALQSLFLLADADGIAARYRGFASLDPRERARPDFRGAGGLAGRRRAARRPGRARVPRWMVWPQHSGARRLAHHRPAGRSHGAEAARLCRPAVARSHRAARQRAAAGDADPGCRRAPSASGACRHGGGQRRRDGTLAAAMRMAALGRRLTRCSLPAAHWQTGPRCAMCCRSDLGRRGRHG